MTQSPETKMTNPPTSQTKMVAKADELVKVRVMEPIFIEKDKRVAQPGEILDMCEADVSEYCDKKFKGPYAHSGMLEDGRPKHHVHVRAMRVTDYEKKLAAEQFQKEQEAIA